MVSKLNGLIWDLPSELERSLQCAGARPANDVLFYRALEPNSELRLSQGWYVTQGTSPCPKMPSKTWPWS
jgi:hypothetical protein